MFKCNKNKMVECKSRIVVEADILHDWSKTIKYSKGDLLCGRGGGECLLSNVEEVEILEPIWKEDALDHLSETIEGSYFAIALSSFEGRTSYHIYNISIYTSDTNKRIENIYSTGFSSWSNLNDAEYQVSRLCKEYDYGYYGIIKGFVVPIL